MSGKKNYPEIPNLKNAPRQERKGGAILWLGKLTTAAAGGFSSKIMVLAGAVGALGIGGTQASLHLQQVRAAKPAAAPQVVIAKQDVFRKKAAVGNQSLAYAADANDGLVRFKGSGEFRDALNKESAAKGGAQAAHNAQDAGKEAAANDKKEDPAFEMPKEQDIDSLLAQEARKKFGGKFGFKKGGSTLNSLLAGAGFSGGNVLGGSPFGKGAFGRDLEAPRALKKAKRREQALGRLRPGPRQLHNQKNRSMSRGYTSKSMGQLKLANHLSYDASRAMSDNKSAQLASDAFDQQRSRGGGDGFHNVGGGGVGEPVVPLGDGAPDLTDNESDRFGEDGLPTAPSFTGQNQTPYDGQMDGIKAKAKKSRKNNLLGQILSASGMALTIAGFITMAVADPTGTAYMVGMIMVIAGMILSLAGMLTSLLGQNQKDDAKSQSRGIGSRHGQQDQAKIAEDYVDAVYEGEDYDPHHEPMPENDVHESVTAQQDATYELGR